MSKMTTEQFLEHLGIEVGKPFMRDGNKETVRKIDKDYGTIEMEHIDEEGNRRIDWNTAQWLMNAEITPLPKYTLTDDEKAIVRCIDNKWKWIVRDNDLSVHERKPYKSKYKNVWCINEQFGSDDRDLSIFEKMFTFVKTSDDEPVSLDELRKCL